MGPKNAKRQRKNLESSKREMAPDTQENPQ